MGYHFPELGKIVTDIHEFILIAYIIKHRQNFLNVGLLPMRSEIETKSKNLGIEIKTLYDKIG